MAPDVQALAWPEPRLGWHFGGHANCTCELNKCRAKIKCELKNWAQLPQYYAQWWDPCCEGVNVVAYDWRGKLNRIIPPWGLLHEVVHKVWEEGAGGTVVAPYSPGQSWFRELKAIADEVVFLPRRRDLFAPSKLGGSEPIGPSSRVAVMFHMQASRLYSITAVWSGCCWRRSGYGSLQRSRQQETATAVGTPVDKCDSAVHDRWRSKLRKSQQTRLAAQMQAEALQAPTYSNYGPRARKLCEFCEREEREWRPASEETARPYVAPLLPVGNVQAESMQPYLWAINNYHEDVEIEGRRRGV
ncbi:hypothetical protein CYMTET_55254 [Cymbomonas tetramitiformis]|uniref:Uncharacterized protein n=1 Tax=Cymbomonas tetramitiformis TaxID=36881 RepID=A0AAE0BEH8_9CHLO|nr:hypothetical protein CYMTET_55254 [Cymbomonas tetramitiformis]